MSGKQRKRASRNRPSKERLSPLTAKRLSEQNTFVPKGTVDPSEALQKPRLEALLFCDYATRTIEGKYILAGIFERLVFTHEEAKITHFFYLFLRMGRVMDGQVQIALHKPDGTIISAIAFEVLASQFSGDYPPQLNFLDKVRFPTPVEGVYWFDVSYRGESLGGAPLIIDFLKVEVDKDEHKSEHAEKRS